MIKFPKKYSSKDLQNWSRFYREKRKTKESNSSVFMPVSLNVSDKISYNDFFLIYLRDFFNCIENLENFESSNVGQNHQNLFFLSNNQFKNISSSFSFFYKRNQKLPQVGVNKLERHIQSVIKKNLNANSKIINANFSSPHKFLMLDSSIYLYIVGQLRSLYLRGKISKQTNIAYRSFNLQCSVPNTHIELKDQKINSYTLKYFIGSKCEALPIVTDDIDLCCGDVGILVHPKDKRYNKHIGKKAIIPLSNRQIPVIGDENVNIATNNGIKRICPCSDQESIELAKQYGLPLDVYVFDKEGLYTDYIHEKAFIGQERNKYYKNIEGFMGDIGNLTEKEEIMKKIPYLKYTNERLVPLKINQIVIDTSEERERILNDIFDKKLYFSFIEDKFGSVFTEIDKIEDSIKSIKKSVTDLQVNEIFDKEKDSNDELVFLEKKKIELRRKIIEELDNFLPSSIVCNSQLPYGWKVPMLFSSDGNLSFFDLEEDFFEGKDFSIQKCFDFILLSLVRIGALGNRGFYDKKPDSWKICEYDKIFQIFSQNEKKICYFIQELIEKTGEKPEYLKLLKIFQNLTDENDSTVSDCRELVNGSQFLTREGNRLLLNFQGISDDVLDPDFIQFCVQCYVNNNEHSKINSKILYDKSERREIFYEIALQYLFLGEPISNSFLEMSYDKENEFFGEKELTKLQLEQTQWNMFNIYGENPVRLCFLLNKTYDQREILLNNIFLKQIWNAVRFCVNKGFLFEDVEKKLGNIQGDFDGVDLFMLYKLNNLYDDWKDVRDFDSYINFFKCFKLSVQDLFFSWYLEIQKSQITENVEFVCSYFFNFLLTVLYPLIPEYVDALCYISGKKFVFPFQKVVLTKTINYNTNLIFETFVRIKKLKIKSDIKQHEYCDIFIKSSPTLGEMLKEYEQIFKSYFHISNITYLRLHEQNLSGYEIDSDEIVSIGVKVGKESVVAEKESVEFLEREMKRLEDKLQLIRERMQILGDGDQYIEAEREYEQVKGEMENLSIKYSLLSNK